MKKVLLLQGTIPHYRVPIFNELAKYVDLTVVYSDGKLPEKVDFKTLCVPTWNLRYRIHKKNIYRMAKTFDAVICMLDFSYIYFRLLNILPHKYKLVYWGIGVPAGYNCRYDSRENADNRFLKTIKKSDAAVFYCDYPKNKYSKMGISDQKLFVANNTVRVADCKAGEKDNILFLGSLYKQKRIHELLENYFSAYKKNNFIPNLVIVGDGDEYENIEKWINENNLSEKVVLKGAIFDDEQLSLCFSNALMCISPDQAGLSVLKSMGNGVPFVTHKNAITGGEIFNIKNGENGILFDDFSEIENIILDCVDNKEYYINMGKKALEYYKNNRTVEMMVKGFVDAVEYVCSKETK